MDYLPYLIACSALAFVLWQTATIIGMPFKFGIVGVMLDSSYSASCSDSAFIRTSRRPAVLLNATMDSE